MYRTLTYVLFGMLLIIAGMHTVNAQCPAATPLVIHSVMATESRCEATGSATVSVSGGTTPYTFSIIAGPALTPPQSSNVLQSLAPGNYTVQVTDNCNTSVTSNFTVTGAYSVPSLNITTQSPGCSASSDGSLTMNVTNGRAPLAYSLISPSPVTAGPQAGNVFTGLPAGTYTCQVNDSCGNYQTRNVTLSASPSSVTVGGGGLQYLGCDSFAIYVRLDITGYKPPYTVTATGPDGKVITHVLTAPALDPFGRINDMFTVKFHHIANGNQTLTLTATNNCGVTNTSTVNLDIGSFDMYPRATPVSGCGGQFAYTFDASYDNSQYPSSLHCSTITYTLVSPSGAIVATQTNNSTFSGFPPAPGYKVIREDCCQKDSLGFDWSGGATFHIDAAYPFMYATCKEGTTGLSFFFNLNNRQGDIVVASGPASMTTADGKVHLLTYPDTIKNVSFNSLYLDYFTIGSYKIVAITTCGEKDSATINIGPLDVRHSSFTASLVKGCTGASRILLNASSNTFQSSSFPDGSITVNSIYNKGANAVPFSDSLTDLSSGTYYASYSYINYYPVTAYLSGMSGWGCDVVTDTIVIPAYTQPAFNPAAAVALCGATRQVALLPDSTRGVMPYQYQIINGPGATPLQASPVFTGLARGTYTFLMADACANSYSRNITIDTLIIPNVATSGNTCVGNIASLTLPSSPFFSYAWQRPNGSTSTGNTLTLNPVSASDLGTYTVSVTSTVGGCTNTSSKNLTLNACQSLGQTLLHFSGQRKNGNIQLNWQTADEINMSYYSIERSTDGRVFTPVQRVAATGGTQNRYTATDIHVPAGIVYYRLQPVETSGNFSYSSIISFTSANTQPFTVYPSLITGNTPVTVNCPVNSRTSFIRIIGVDGKVLRTIAVAAGTTKASIDVTNLARGSYFVVFSGNDTVVTTQVWKE
jgi:hypothetical protein